MYLRARIREAVREARRELYVAGRNDRLRELRNGVHRTAADALADLDPEPPPPTDDEVDAILAGYVADAESIRQYAREHGAGWTEQARERWERTAAALEDRARAEVTS